MSQPLTNYLKTHRKRSGFSLEELGFLLGHRSGSTAGKHERFRRLPTITTALAYEIVFQKPARELFRGVYQRVERETIRRALELSKDLGEQPASTRDRLKQETLRAIYLPLTEQTDNHHEKRG